MIVVSFETEKNQEEIMDRAVRYFGSIGLKLSERGDCCIYFEDANQSGYVKVTLS